MTTSNELAEDYEVLRDHIIEQLNPHDDDTSELTIMCDAVTGAVAYIESQPCTCTRGASENHNDPCNRCAVLGRRENKRIEC